MHGSQVVDSLEFEALECPEGNNDKLYLMEHLPVLNKDNTDRNRTSPFAFTGNKFEMRAPGMFIGPLLTQPELPFGFGNGLFLSLGRDFLGFLPFLFVTPRPPLFLAFPTVQGLLRFVWS